MKNNTVGYPAPFQSTFNREKLAFLELANNGNGLTPINYIGATEGAFEFINVDNIIAGTIEVNIIYSTGITNLNSISSPVIDVGIANIQTINVDIIESNLTSAVQFNSPARFYSSDTNSWVSFLPNTNINVTYTWPEPPGFFIPTPAFISVGPYMTSDRDGNLSWKNTIVLPEGGYKVGPYMTSNSEGKLSWDSYDVPAVSGVYEIGPYLTSDSTGKLSWGKSIVTVAIP